MTEMINGFFIDACYNGDLATLTQLKTDSTRKQWGKILKEYNYSGFQWACENGQVASLNFLKEHSTNDQWNSMLKARDCIGFRGACRNGRVPVLEFLKEYSTPKQWKAMFIAADYNGFRGACGHGHVDVLKFLKGNSKPKQWDDMLIADNYGGFQKACEYGHVPVLKFLKGNSKPKQWDDMLIADNYGGFQKACEYGHVPVLDFLRDKKNSMAEQWNAMLEALDCAGFQEACINNKPEAAHFIAPEIVDAQKKIDWTIYKHWDRNTFQALNGLQIPEMGDIPSTEARHFGAVGAKLARLKAAFPQAPVATMLGNVNFTPRNTTPWQRINKESEDIRYADVDAMIDAVREISKYVACYILKTKTTDDVLRTLDSEALMAALEPIQNKVAAQILEGNSLVLLKKISDTWHRKRAGVVPNKIRDFAEEGAWHPLMADNTIEIPCTEQGLEHYRFINLTTSAELDAESKAMGGLCVNGYSDQCKNEGFQVFSLQKLNKNGEWQHATTLGFAVENGKLKPATENQHQGYGHRSATSEEKKVAEWLRTEVNEGRLKANFNRLGEIKTEHQLSAFENAVGVTLEKLTPDRMGNNFATIAHVEHHGAGHPFGKSMRNKSLAAYIEELGLANTGHGGTESKHTQQLKSQVSNTWHR